MRKASGDMYRHHWAVVLAWVRGAQVGDGDPVTDKGLRWSLVRVIDELHGRASKKARLRRPHRGNRDDESAFQLELIPDPTERRMVLDVVADAMAGEQIQASLAKFAAEMLAPLTAPLLERLAEGTTEVVPASQSSVSLVASLEDHGVAAFSSSAELSAAAAQSAVATAPRDFLDQVRDNTRRMLLGDSATLAREQQAIGLIVGQLITAPLFDGSIGDRHKS
jgi:hypothetical protein